MDCSAGRLPASLASSEIRLIAAAKMRPFKKGNTRGYREPAHCACAMPHHWDQTNHTRSQTDLYFRQLSACVLLPQYGMIATRSIERRWRSGGLQPPAEWSGRNVSLTFGRSPLPARAPRAIGTTNLLERGQSPRIHLHRQRLQLLAPAADDQPGAERHRAIGDLRRGVVHHALLAMQYFVHC
jgi:hypothetical protein